MMAPVLLTGLTKITDQPDEVRNKSHTLHETSYVRILKKFCDNNFALFRMKNYMNWPTLESVAWLSEPSTNNIP